MKSLVRPGRRVVFGMLFAMTLGWAATAQAKKGLLEKAFVVFEVYIGDESLAKTPAYANALVETLEKSPYVAVLSRADGEKLLAGHAMKSVRATDAQLSARKERLKEAGDALLNGDDNAIPLIEKSLRMLTRLAAKVVFDEKLHALYLENYMLLSRAHSDAGQGEELVKVLEQVMRFFGVSVINEQDFHPRIVKVWRKLEKQLRPERTCTLEITSEPPGADIMIQGKKLDQKTPVTLKGFIPGDLLIQVQKGGAASMAHMVKLKANSTSVLKVDLSFEQALKVSGDRFGLSFPTQEAFEANGPAFAGRIGQLLDVDKVLLVWLKQDGASVEFAGATIDAQSGQLEKRASVEARANVVVKSRVRKLGWELVRDSLVSGESDPWYTNTWGWVAAGVGVVGIAVSFPFLADFNTQLNELKPGCTYLPCTVNGEVINTNDDLREAIEGTQIVQGIGNTLWIGGAVALVGSILLFTLTGGGDEISEKQAFPTLQSLGPTRLIDGSLGLGATFGF